MIVDGGVTRRYAGERPRPHPTRAEPSLRPRDRGRERRPPCDSISRSSRPSSSASRPRPDRPRTPPTTPARPRPPSGSSPSWRSRPAGHRARPGLRLPRRAGVELDALIKTYRDRVGRGPEGRRGLAPARPDRVPARAGRLGRGGVPQGGGGRGPTDADARLITWVRPWSWSASPTRAAEAFERALTRKPARTDLLDIYQALGRVHQRAHRNDRALAVWDRLEKAFPDEPGSRSRSPTPSPTRGRMRRPWPGSRPWRRGPGTSSARSSSPSRRPS